MSTNALMAQDAEAPRPAVELNTGPGSLVSMLPAKVQQLVEEALFLQPELFNKNESELAKYLAMDQAQVTPTDNRLRLKFWMEYDRARMAGVQRMTLDNVIAGICYRESFYSTYLSKPAKVAWLLCIPAGYQLKTMETLEFGIDKMREILDMDPEKYGAKAAPQMLALKQKITDMMNSWIKGAPVQRSLAVNVHTGRQIQEISTDLSMEELEKRLKDLEKRTKIAKNIPIDITPEDLADE